MLANGSGPEKEPPAPAAEPATEVAPAPVEAPAPVAAPEPAPVESPAINHSGAYIGVQFGYGTGRTNISGTQAPILLNNVLGSANNFSTGFTANGGFGGLHIGQGKQFANRLYMGFEVYGNFSGVKGDTTQNLTFTNAATGAVSVVPTNIKAERRANFGFALRPGVAIDRALVYLKLGVEGARWKYTVNNSSNTSTRTGLFPGLGVDFLLNDHFKLGVEGTYTFYNNKTVNGVKFKSRVADFAARIGYKF